LAGPVFVHKRAESLKALRELRSTS